jgi:TfoX/Sxy family transcriptional regulator of competence genes
MKWKKVSVEFSALLEESLQDFDCQKRMMFGCPAYFVNNNMFTGVHQDNIILRLSEDSRTEIRSKYDEAIPFEPMKGRVMKEYVVLPEVLYSDAEDLNHWLNKSYEYVLTLPTTLRKTKNKNKGSSPN